MATLSVRDHVVGEGDGFVDVTIALDAPAAQTVTVNYASIDSTADRFGDYVSASGTLSFAPGETAKTVRVNLRSDTTAEAFESFFVQLSSPTNATIAQALGMINVVDNDTLVATPELYVRDVVVDEKQGTATFAVTLGNVRGTASGGSVSVDYRTADLGALAGSDYTSRTGTLTFAPGEVVKTVTVPLLDDGVAEGIERFSLLLSNPLNATLGDGFALAEIAPSDATATAQPRISVGDHVVGEGDGWVDVVVALSAPGQNPVSVAFTTVDSSADRFGDYVSRVTTLTFAPGETAKVVRVELRDGTTAEEFTSLLVLLSNATNATIARQYGVINVIDNDTTTDVPQLFVRDVVVDEAQRTARFAVLLGGVDGRASNSVVTVDFGTVAATADSGSDYAAAAGTLRFAPGEVAKVVTIDLADDTLAEGLERFALQLSNPVNAGIAHGLAWADIAANDATAMSQPRVVVGDAMVGEGDGFVDVVVSLSAPGQNVVTVNFTTVDGTADRFADYVSNVTTLTFAPGETAKVVRIELRDGTAPEAFEALQVLLSNATNATIARPYGLIGVIDNDSVVDAPQLFVRDAVVDERQGTAVFTVMLGNAVGRSSNSTVSVGYTTADAGALGGSDFVARSGVLSFAPGEVTQTVVVDLLDDSLAEGIERFALVLGNPVNATIGDGDALGEIMPSDATATSQPRISIGSYAAGEGDSFVDVVVSLSAPGQNVVTVAYTTADGSADRFADYVSDATTLTFAPGETAKVVRVELRDGTTSEGFESFHVVLSNATGASIADAAGLIEVWDNDNVVDTPQVHVRDVVVDERAGTARFSVALGQTVGQSSNGTVRVGYATRDGTAHAGHDYAGASGTLEFAPGEVVKTVVVDLLDDALGEPDERFALVLTSAVGASIADGSAAAVIAANDATPAAQPRLALDSRVVAESDGFVELAVRLSAPAQSAVSVNVVTGDGSANRFSDYLAVSATLNFAPGETVKVVRVELRDDGVAEGSESFTLALSGAVNAVLGNSSATVTIADNDAAGAVVLSYGTGDDTYRGVTAATQIIENPGGGRDTIVVATSATLPEQIENAVLSGGAAANLTGHAANNVLRGNAGNNVLDGQGGIDTAVYAGPLAAYQRNAGAPAAVSGPGDGSDTLISIERLQFADQVLAFDTAPGGHTYAAYALLNAGFDAAPPPSLLGQWTAQLDQLGGNTVALAQSLLNYYAPGLPNDALVTHLWRTIVGGPIPAAELTALVGLIESGQFTQASLFEYASLQYPLNPAEIAGIVGQPVVMDPAWFPVPG